MSKVVALKPTNWKCTTCGSTHTSGVICTKCFTHMTPDRDKFPQIFDGLRFHFNGIVQKSLLSQSFNKEWRMAVAHGAECTTECDLRSVKMISHLIYRRGYERSDKVRAACLNPKAFVVPVEWMLDSMMAKQRLPEGDVRLKEIPLRALPLDPNSTSLEHHRHPFYVANHEKFPEPSAVEVTRAKTTAKQHQEESKKENSMVKVPLLEATNLTVIEPWPIAAKSQLPVLSGCRLLFTESCPAQAKECVAQHGAIVVTSEQGLAAPGLTHLIYAPEDRKSPLMAQAILAAKSSLVITPLLWVQDCVQAKEHLPNAGPYVIPAKLLNAVKKKPVEQS